MSKSALLSKRLLFIGKNKQINITQKFIKISDSYTYILVLPFIGEIMNEKTREELLLELQKLNKAQIRIKRRSTFLLSIIAMLVLVTGTLAWFTLNSFAGVDNLTMQITTGVDLRVDMVSHGSDIKQYQKIITNEMINSYLSKYNTSIDKQRLDPVTTKNGITFVGQKGDAKSPNQNTYLEFQCYFIASRDMWVHLSTDSGNTDYEATSVTTTETGTKADVVRSVRLSYEDSGNAAIYEPNKGTPVNGQTTFDLTTPMQYSNSTRLFHLNELEPKLITIRLWADGEDPECDDDVQQANLTVKMLFSGTDDANVPYSQIQ